jgi:hypothetical protein
MYPADKNVLKKTPAGNSLGITTHGKLTPSYSLILRRRKRGDNYV